MKHRLLFTLLVLAATLSTHQLRAQSDEAALLERAFNRLDKAKIDKVREQANETLRSDQESGDKLDARAKVLEAIASIDKAQNPEAMARRAQAERILEQAKARLREKGIDSDAVSGGIPSIPAVRSTGQPDSADGNSPAPRARPAAPPVGIGVRPDGVPDPSGAAPAEPRKIPAVAKKRKANQTQPTEIHTAGANAVSYIDNAKRVAVFTGDVYLVTPDFEIWCDELQIFLKPDGAEDKAAAATTENGETTASLGGGIHVAVALGRRVVVRKVASDGSPRIGQCQRLVYYADSEEIVLTESPRLQLGRDLVKSTDPKTQIILRRNGQHDVNGPHKIDLIDDEEKALVPVRPGG